MVRVGIFLIVAALIAGIAGCDGYTPSEDIEIRDWYDLDAVRDNLGGSYILMNDLDSTAAGYEELAGPTANGGLGWQPIGNFTDSFTVTFDGQGYEISDLFIKRVDEWHVGLFGYVEGGRIDNIGLVDATVTGKGEVGGLVGNNKGIVSNSYAIGTVTGTGEVSFVGGLAGCNYGTVSSSYSTGTVTGHSSVGGLVGYNSGKVTDSHSVGDVAGDSDIGGLVGYNGADNGASTVINSYSTGSVSGNEDVGGLVGFNFEGTVSNSFWDIETSGQATSDGGTGKTTAQMQDIATFSGAGWDIIAVALNETNQAYIWNIVDAVTYPFLSWEA